MNLHVWWDDPADGPSNMAADELLAAEAAERGGMCVRLYGWTPATVSLGGFQRSADAGIEPAIAGVSIVRRPSGGGAIVHGTDLTYAAAVPKAHPWGGRPQLLYDALHEAMRVALLGCGIEVALWRPARLPSNHAHDAMFFCFDRRASGDLVWLGTEAQGGRGHKVMGSAQRRLASTVLQHGSLLLRRNRSVGPSASHAGLADLVPDFLPETAVRPLVKRWLAGVAAALGAGVVEEPGAFLNEEILRERAQIFASTRWTDRR
jgi:lipoate-protein ligase A